MICFDIIFKQSQLLRKNPLPVTAEMLEDLRLSEECACQVTQGWAIWGMNKQAVWATGTPHPGGRDETEVNRGRNSQACSQEDVPHHAEEEQRQLGVIVHCWFTIDVVLW